MEDKKPAGGRGLPGQRKASYSPYRIAGGYLLFGILWILFSDQLANTLVHDPGLRAAIQIGKGWFYVLITALFLFFFIRRDIHKQQETARILSKALEEQAVLLREVHHRVKNNLQIITSLIHLQQSGKKDSKPLTGELAAIERRIAAIAQVHQELYQGHELSRISLEILLSALAGTFPALQWRVNVPTVPLTLDTAVPLSLIVNEIASNAESHAYGGEGEEGIFSRRPLLLEARFQEDQLVLEISDEGRGFLPEKEGGADGAGEVPADLSQGLGHLLISSLAGQLEGTWKVWSSPGMGTTHRLLIPAGLRNGPGSLS